MNPESGKTCKEIAPSTYRIEDIGLNKILKEFDLSLRRNYKRMSLSEERLSERSGGKDIDPHAYFNWRVCVLKAMRLWRQKQISDEEFLNIVNELD